MFSPIITDASYLGWKNMEVKSNIFLLLAEEHQ